MIDPQWLLLAGVLGLALTVYCSPRRDALLWWLPGFMHRLIYLISGYVLAKRVFYMCTDQGRRIMFAWYWRKK